MRKAVIKTTLAASVALGAAGLAGTPALADSGSSGQPMRLAQNNGGQNLFNLYQQIQQLQAQVRQLNGEVDTLKYKLKQNEQGQRDLYKNLDKRLSKLENGGGSSSDGTSDQSGGGQAGSDDYGSGASNVDSATQSAYMDGFSKLKNGQYDAAIASLKKFVSQHPDSSLTDNAWYWLGEANYVQQNLGDAENAFDAVVNKFKNSPKVPASLYKIGLIQAAQNQTDNAKATLSRVIDQYPDSDSAGLAKQKLQSLGSG